MTSQRHARLCEYIEHHIGQTLSIARLARHARLSPYHFVRVFRDVSGETPHRYVRRRRIERAKTLLVTTPMPVTDVCEAAGFHSLGSFSALFRRMTGETPRAYRAARRKRPYIPQCFARMYRVDRP
jgi:AraC-like DNA-binding protein